MKEYSGYLIMQLHIAMDVEENSGQSRESITAGGCVYSHNEVTPRNENCLVDMNRSCGKVFCASCSNFFCQVPHEQLYGDVRVCEKCFYKLDGHLKRNSSQNFSPA